MSFIVLAAPLEVLQTGMAGGVSIVLPYFIVPLPENRFVPDYNSPESCKRICSMKHQKRESSKKALSRNCNQLFFSRKRLIKQTDTGSNEYTGQKESPDCNHCIARLCSMFSHVTNHAIGKCTNLPRVLYSFALPSSFLFIVLISTCLLCGFSQTVWWLFLFSPVKTPLRLSL